MHEIGDPRQIGYFSDSGSQEFCTHTYMIRNIKGYGRLLNPIHGPVHAGVGLQMPSPFPTSMAIFFSMERCVM